MAARQLYSIDQVAERLGLHVRTVRNYVRDGRLKAVRIGKQYRIAPEDLDELTGRPAPAGTHAEVSSVVDIDGVGRALADRASTLLMGVTASRREDDAGVRVETVYDVERARLKIIILGSLETSAELFTVIGALLENQ